MRIVPLCDYEAEYLAFALEAFGGNVTAAAKALRIDRRTLYRKIERRPELKRVRAAVLRAEADRLSSEAGE